uniref:Gp2 n=1 Tax=Caviid herpesvirus 2 str. CIDMTR TaxID=1415526 RepID=U6H8A1_9BETA|nr:gp2 [Caviid herpesvirus 2 str. CIDMTR]
MPAASDRHAAGTAGAAELADAFLPPPPPPPRRRRRCSPGRPVGAAVVVSVVVALVPDVTIVSADGNAAPDTESAAPRVSTGLPIIAPVGTPRSREKNCDPRAPSRGGGGPKRSNSCRCWSGRVPHDSPYTVPRSIWPETCRFIAQKGGTDVGGQGESADEDNDDADDEDDNASPTKDTGGAGCGRTQPRSVGSGHINNLSVANTDPGLTPAATAEYDAAKPHLIGPETGGDGDGGDAVGGVLGRDGGEEHLVTSANDSPDSASRTSSLALSLSPPAEFILD